MSKWISEAYIKMLMQTDRLLQGNCEYKLWEQEVEKIVDAMPSIDIVRCKECKHYFYDELNDCKMCYIHEYGEIWEDNDFCSYGVRKTNTTAEEKPTPIRDYMVHGEREGE